MMRPRGRETGSMKDVDFWTSKKDPYETTNSHVNYMVPDSKWESQVAYALDQHENVGCYVKNKGLGFAVPYLHGGQLHEFLPDFIVRLQMKGKPVGMLILEPKGYDKLAEVKATAAARWCKAVNAEGKQPLPWAFEMFSEPGKVREIVSESADALARVRELK